MFSVQESFHRELAEIKRMFESEIRFKTARFEELVDIHFDDLDHNACVLIVLTFNHAFGEVSKSAVGLAKIIQYIFMADQVHRTMEDRQSLPEKSRQFPVLVGDYLYGKFFLELCKEELLHYLNPMAKVIGLMNEGAILRWVSARDKKPMEKQRILEMERASLAGLAARLGAELAGCPKNVLGHCEELGGQLGLAWAAHKEQNEAALVREALGKAKEILGNWPVSREHRLHDLVDYIEGHLAKA